MQEETGYSKKIDTWPSTAMYQSEVVTIQWLFKKVSEIGSKITLITML